MSAVATLSCPVSTKPKGDPPIGWSWITLGDIARLESGHTPSRRSPEYWEGGNVAWLSLKDIRGLSGKYVMETIDQPTMLGIDNSSARLLPKGTVALCRTASVGNVVILGREMATSQDFVNWVCGPKLLPEYLYWAFRCSGATFDIEKQGSTHQTIYMPVVSRFQLLLPSLEEQRRIADVLDRAEALRAKRRDALAQLDTLTQAIFTDTFGDPVTNPKRFPPTNLGAIIDFVGGSQPPRETFTYEPSPDTIRLVQIRDFRTDEFKTYIPGHLAKRFFDTDDVMIGRYGPPVFQIFRGLSGTYNVALMKALPRGDVLKDFIFYLLQESRLHAYVVARSERTAGQSGVNLTLLENYPAYLPPLTLQREFAQRVVCVERLRASHRASLVELDALFAALQHRAFRGEL